MLSHLVFQEIQILNIELAVLSNGAVYHAKLTTLTA